ncbi:unnamed protein product [Arabidopsis thaliana]|uniref:(thale cress) hypothetical protein n=1 Tax=Arabidopsis thaliana TaxID=3702 RepID=A0A7G2FIM2_ARATH|nr:unnamed protein product [Arabidopsis thaliana]
MGCLRSLVRRKQFDSSNGKAETHHHHQQLAKALTFPHLIAIGVGSTIGAGVYILVGTVAREHSGPALALSFLIAGISAALSAFCYAELSSRFPSAGSAYHYSYICIGEGVAWLIGWALILEYTIGGSTVARGISPNLAMIFGGEDCLPTILARHQIPGLDIVVDPCAAVLVFIVTGLCCLGVKESTFAQGIVTTANVFVMIFVIVAGSYLCFKTGWVGYELPTGYFPYGVDGMLTGSATVFFAYIGFDTVASMAEEVKNPRRDLPLVMEFNGLRAVMALCSALMGSILPQPRILMAMARDGLLPSYFSYVNQRTQVPINGTITTGVCAAILAFFMDVSQLAGMVSVGTLVAFTMVAISLLIVRYVVPPDEVPLPSSLQENSSSHLGTSIRSKQPLLGKVDDSVVDKENAPGSWVLNKKNRRKFAGWSIMFTCIGNFLLSYAASSFLLPGLLRYSLCGVGGLFLLVGLIVLICIDQDDARHSFGHSGGFICPFVPLLPIVCILINMYLLVNLGAATWARVSVWLFLGVVVYIFYGRRNSSLVNAVYVSTAHLQEIRRTSGHSLA